MYKPHVLVVDDQKSARITLRVLIEDLGAIVSTFEDGYQAIEGARESSFDLAFIDIEMPGINGVQTLRELMKLRPGTVAVMVTGYGEARLVKEALNEGAVAVLLKPYDTREIASLVDKVSRRPVKFESCGQQSAAGPGWALNLADVITQRERTA
ncbi:MAG: response regulator [Chloroflexi bacterium]|nr:response regulator [Chloroflexota bacterium]